MQALDDRHSVARTKALLRYDESQLTLTYVADHEATTLMLISNPYVDGYGYALELCSSRHLTE